MTLEDIGVGDGALTCVTDQPFCCRPPYSSVVGQSALGNWYFPNGTRVHSIGVSWDFYRTRSQMLISLQRRRGGEDGIYNCTIPDAMNVTQTIYIGVYTAETGEWYIYIYTLVLSTIVTLQLVQESEIQANVILCQKKMLICKLSYSYF